MRHGSALFEPTDRNDSPYPGYCRMFSKPTRPITPRAKLLALATAQLEQHAPPASALPAGYTYLGQFIDHDITRMRRTASPPQDTRVPVDELVQQASPELDLDCLYGAGFSAPDKIGLDKETGSFMGQKLTDGTELLFDFSRECMKSGGIACIADPRNDENFLIAQLHIFFMNLHNKVVRVLKDPNPTTAFASAQKIVRGLYVSVIKHDFLKRILSEEAYKNLILGNGFDNFWKPGDSRQIPIEFTGAAYRFGHSLVQRNYKLNAETDVVTLRELFKMTGRGGATSYDRIRTFRIDWSFFFTDKNNSRRLNFARPVSCRLAGLLSAMPNEAPDNNNLAARNLLRGNELALPAAEEAVDELLAASSGKYAKALAIVKPSDYLANRLTRFPSLRSVLKDEFEGQTPLWAYVLLEPTPTTQDADPHWDARLGPLGSVIVGEVFRTLLQRAGQNTNASDIGSFCVENGIAEGDLTQLNMRDLVDFVHKAN